MSLLSALWWIAVAVAQDIPEDSVEDPVEDSVEDHVEDSVEDHVQDFVEDHVEDFVEDETVFEIVVEETSPDDHDTHARTTLDEQALDRSSGSGLADTVSQVAGVQAGRGTSDNAKPIIRGQVERRLLVLFDGVRHESQKWGADHSTEIDPFAAGSISVVKGAAGVHYGPDAIGGVVLVEPPPMRDAVGVDGKAQLVGVTNGMRGVGAIRLDVVPEALPDTAFRAEGNVSRGASVSAPDYVLGNTGSFQWNGALTVRHALPAGELKAAWRHYDLTAGICYCVQNGTQDEFLAQLQADRPTGSQQWTTDYAIDRPKQQVSHDLAMLRYASAFDNGSAVRVTYAFQLNHRREFEQVRDSVEGPQYDFVLRTHTLDASYTHPARKLGNGTVEGGVGLTGTYQENVYSGLPLVPNHRAISAGVTGFEGVEWDRASVEVGARYDHQTRSSFLAISAFERHLSRDTLAEDDCERTPDAARCALNFDTGSGSVGTLVHLVPDRLDLKIDLSTASRFPNGDELYMNGSAPTAPVYALGDPSLGVETTVGASPTLGLSLPWLAAEASGFANWIFDYIDYSPEIVGGEPQFDVTIRGAYPRFRYRPLDARFVGGDGGFTLGPEAAVALRGSVAVVRGVNVANGNPLLFVPADRATGAVRVQPAYVGPLVHTFAEASGTWIARSVIPARLDLAPPPDPAVLVGAALGAAIELRGEREISLGAEATNLLNTNYRELTSLLRYYADEPGRSIRVRVGVDF